MPTAGHADANVTSFLIGSEANGNREVITLADDASYDLDPTTIVNSYATTTTQFPYPTS